MRTDPKLAESRFRARGLEPLEPFPGTDKAWRARCVNCGNEVSPRYAQLDRMKNACRYCAGKDVNPEDAAAIMRASGLEPLESYPGGHERWRCRCVTCDNEVSPHYSLVKSRQSGCKYCKGRAVPKGEPERLASANGLEPLEKYPGSGARWRCRCTTCDKEVVVRFDKMKARGYRCIFCQGRPWHAVEMAKRDWTESHVREVFLSRGLEPLEPFPGAVIPWRCRCSKCLREVSPTAARVIGRGTGCRYCAGNVTDENTIARIMSDAGLEPLEPYKSALAEWRMRCHECGNEFEKRYNSVQQGNGCPFCNTRGFDLSGPAMIYVITHPERRAHKLGVMGSETQRLRHHGREGWITYKTRNIPSGLEAYTIEQFVLNEIRNTLRLSMALSRDEMPQGGWTETVSADDIDLPSLWEIVRESVDDWLD